MALGEQLVLIQAEIEGLQAENASLLKSSKEQIMRKLYKVTATFEYVVVADDASIKFVEQEHVRDAISDMSATDIDYRHEPYTPGYADGWSGDCSPYNGASMTIDEWMGKLK